ncbi:hypothetical protein TruAng_005290 [Truncatella angustata]|nr:hypothetical protein TruAng_005290 [Truncatella angustata]
MTTVLRHIRIPSSANRLPAYESVVGVQAHLQKRLHEYKAALSLKSPAEPGPVAPPPTLISFTPAPTYTLGRRQVGPLSKAEEARLRAPLYVRQHGRGSAEQPWLEHEPEVVNAPRGGLATYHGPGQVVFWPVIDLHSPYHSRFTVRDYACLLEKTTIAMLAELRAPPGGSAVEGFTTDNPGVWVKHSAWSARLGRQVRVEGAERKISALGVHLRRHVTGLGVAVNVSMPVTGPEGENPWARIVACGLEDKGVTSVMRELYGRGAEDGDGRLAEGLADDVRAKWAQQFEERLGMDWSLQAEEYKDPMLETLLMQCPS